MTRSHVVRSVRLVTLSAVLVLGLVGCLHSTYCISEADAGALRILERGDTLIVRLSSNASTGYAWERVAPETFAGGSLEPLGEGAYRNLGSAPGSPGVTSFRYAAVGSGTVTLRFVYRRPWEEEPPIEDISFIIYVD